ncbi:MAG: saccharopine dehydrogenase C-terminal domain-containing protein [Candidatus Bathyarchaeia archaeon]
MKIAVLGAGLMGPALAMDCLESPEVEEVLLVDIDKERLRKVAERLGNPSKLITAVQDVRDRQGLIEVLKGYDVAGIALLRWLNVDAIWGCIEAKVHAVDLASAAEKDWSDINSSALRAGVTVIPGCGVEPGLVDILAAYGMDMLDCVESVRIWCGGIPRDPKPPLDYKIVFGGPYLPLRPGVVKTIENGKETYVKRYTLGEPICFEGIERPLECFYDGFPQTLYEIEKFKGVKNCSEMTVRYAGYCEKVNFLDNCGLLSRDPIMFEGKEIIPFEVFSRIIYPKVRLEEKERDITVFRVIVEGYKDGCETCYTFETVDHYDEVKDITSMAKTTSYTAAIVARMIGRGDITERGLVPPVRVIRGELTRRLLRELRERGVVVKEVVTTKRVMGC